MRELCGSIAGFLETYARPLAAQRIAGWEGKADGKRYGFSRKQRIFVFNYRVSENDHWAHADKVRSRSISQVNRRDQYAPQAEYYVRYYSYRQSIIASWGLSPCAQGGQFAFPFRDRSAQGKGQYHSGFGAG